MKKSEQIKYARDWIRAGVSVLLSLTDPAADGEEPECPEICADPPDEQTKKLCERICEQDD